MRLRQSRRKSIRGFTLLEAILALGVFGIACLSLFRALNEISLTTVESAENSVVTERMRSYLTEILRNPRLLPGETETEPDSEGYVFRALVEELPLQTETGKQLRQMYTVRIEALRSPPGGGNLEIVDEAETYRFAPLYRQ